MNPTALKKEADTVEVALGRSQVQRGATVKVTDAQVVTQEHVSSEFVQVSLGSSVHHADDGVSFALVQDPSEVFAQKSVNQGCHDQISPPHLGLILRA